MTPKIDLFAAAPALMRDYQRASITSTPPPGLSRASPKLVKLRSPRSTVVRTALISMPLKHARTEKPSSASTCYRLGARPLATPIVNAPHSAGRKP